METYTFKNYERENVYKVTNVIVHAVSLNEAKNKVVDYYTKSSKQEKLQEKNEVIELETYYEPFTNIGAAFITCDDDDTTTVNGIFK